ncbi:hypothetical protein [uncultured Eubacterium sp.]|uniref:hypothetical protein n=1 Tax=uncultured Eubacterium sp. TaxID=165185 RepID=UPI00259A5377|nr:hypothetical protein [uncultured Eubacterium sp.]
MRKNVNKKSNNRSKVVSALAMLLVSAVALSSASYAWFTMSKEVSVTGIKLSATAPDNVLITTNGYDVTKIDSYKSSIAIKSDNSLNEVLKTGVGKNLQNNDDAGSTAVVTSGNSIDKLYPMSSTDGISKFATSNAEVEGYSSNATTFTNAENGTELYYVDVPLYILTTGTTPVDLKLDETQSSITDSKNKEIYKAVRFAVLNEGATATALGTFAASDEYWTYTDGKYAADGAKAGAIKTLNANKKGTQESADEIADIPVLKGTNGAKNTKTIQLAKADTDGATVDGRFSPKKVIVRIWIEGENKNCVNKNADQSFEVSLTFKNAKAN